jgi:hypothetical protein
VWVAVQVEVRKAQEREKEEGSGRLRRSVYIEWERAVTTTLTSLVHYVTSITNSCGEHQYVTEALLVEIRPLCAGPSEYLISDNKTKRRRSGASIVR